MLWILNCTPNPGQREEGAVHLTLGFLYRKYVLTEGRLVTTDSRKRFLNELNILFTKGLKSLTMFVPDAMAYLRIVSVLKRSAIL